MIHPKNIIASGSRWSLLPLMLLLVAPLSAQDSALGDVVEDQVTVTAQRVEQSLQEVPISIITVSAEALEDRAISDIQDLADEAHGLVVSGQSSSTGEVALTIRGIGSNTFGLGTESTVGYYVDGVYIPRPQGFLNHFLDVERIEVLRGPQGTLWGRNSTGGALNVVTKNPSAQFRGRLSSEYGELGGPASATEQKFAGSVSGALSDNVFARLSASQADSEDTTFNTFTGRNVDNVDGYGARGSLQFNLSDSTSLLVRADTTDDDSHNNFSLRPNISSSSTLGTLLRFYGLQVPTDVHEISANIEPVSQYDESGASIDLTSVLGSGIELQSITSFRQFDSRRVADVDATPLDFVENVGIFDSEWYSQEFKLNGSSDNFDWIAGAYYLHEEGTSNVDNRTDFGLFELHFFASNPGLFLFNPTDFCSLGFIAPTFLCGIDYYSALAGPFGLRLPGNVSSGLFFISELETDSYAGYGQLYWHLNDEWTLTGGLRYTRDDKKHAQNTIDFITQAPARFVESNDWDGLTPKLGVEFRPQDDLMFYGSITTGFKSGGFNSISVQPSFDEETVTSYEIGVKSLLANGKVTLNAAAFHYDYDDLQIAVLFPDRSSVENAAEATINGLELDLFARPSSRFQLELGISVLDDEFDSFSSQDPLEVARVQDALNAQGILDPTTLAIAGSMVPTTDLAGHSLQRAPDFSANAAAQYRFTVGDAGTLSVRGQYTYTDDISFDPFGNLGQSAYGLFNANINYAPKSGNWFVNLYGRNLGDEEYRVGGLFARVTGSLEVWAPPQSAGIQVGINF